MSPSPRRNGNLSNRVNRVLKKTKMLYVTFGLTVVTAAYLVTLTVQKIQRNAATSNKYTRNLENYSKHCGYFGKNRSAPKGFSCVKPIPPGGLPKGFFGHLGDIVLASKYLINALFICAIIGALSSAYLKYQQSRLAGVAVSRANNETGLAKRSGQTTVRTAENLEEVTRECIAGAKNLIKAMNKITEKMAEAALNNSPNKTSKILNLRAIKEMLEEELKKSMILISSAGQAQQFFLNTLTSEERAVYNAAINQHMMNTGALALQTANQLQQSGVVATTGRFLKAAKNTGTNIARLTATGGASLLLPSGQRRRSPPALPAPSRRSPPALPAPSRRSPPRRSNGAGPSGVSPPRIRVPGRSPPALPAPNRRRSPSTSPNSKASNKALSNLLRQFN